MKVLITGITGFKGSHLADYLLTENVEVFGIARTRSKLDNIKHFVDKIVLLNGDIRDGFSIKKIVAEVRPDFIFHLAGQNDHVLSLTNPFPDIDINIKGSAVLLEACKKHNKDVKLVYTGTRGEYGPAVNLPVREDAPINPKGIYELSNLTAEKLFKIYNDNHGVQSTTLRIDPSPNTFIVSSSTARRINQFATPKR